MPKYSDFCLETVSQKTSKDKFNNYEYIEFISNKSLTPEEALKEIGNPKGCWIKLSKKQMNFKDGRILYKHIITLEWSIN